MVFNKRFNGWRKYFWQGTPLIKLYDAHAITKSASGPIKEAGKSAGRLLKQVIASDKSRTFETKEEEQIRKYRWVS